MKQSGPIYLGLNALVFATISAMAFVNPEAFARTIDFALLTPSAVPELLATYGGLMLVIACLIALSLFLHRRRAMAYFLITLSYVGFSGGRLVGILAHSGFDWRNFFFLAAELVLLVWGAACYWQERGRGLAGC
ncbi:DUF4345 family protein [Microbulbifer sp. TYP-18]|uniref:DUF4345 family protein n=1 Tax=Microbulbifer sp. TYP-18 TaxID=3230024 RepID=UPI0034C657E5